MSRFTVKSPQFPNMVDNYQQTVAIPQETARQEAAEAARKAQEVSNTVPVPIVAPRPLYVAPGDSFKAFIYNAESGNDPGAINATSGACGLGQALPCSKMPCSLSDYACQDAFFTNYMEGRYGTWAAAYSFWIGHRWW